MDERIGDAIALNDLDGLVRLVETLCDERDWDAVVELRDRARQAFDTGRQLWPAAELAEYRLALDAPAEYAASVLTEDAGRFALGPLSEVAATTHTWEELAPHAPRGPVASLAAHERVVRGETIDPSTVTAADVLSVPLALASWEPQYFTPVYRRDRVEEDGPEPVRGRPLALPSSAAEVNESVDVEIAVRELVRPWTARSDGAARVVSVHGDIAAAIAALDVSECRGAFVDGSEAIALLAWAGASGGDNARRRGAAVGRDLAWSVAAALAGLDDEPIDTGLLGDAVAELRWYVWNGGDATTGWSLRLAVEDPLDGLAWAIDAADR